MQKKEEEKKSATNELSLSASAKKAEAITQDTTQNANLPNEETKGTTNKDKHMEKE